MIPVNQTVSPNFFGDGGWIHAKKAGDILKGCSLHQFIFDINTVIKRKVFLISRYVFAHRDAPSTAIRRRDNYTTYV